MIIRYTLDDAPDASAPVREVPPQRQPRRFAVVHAMAGAFIDAWPFRGGEYLARKAASAVLPPLRGPSRCRTRMGFDLVVSPGDGGNYHYLGAYERGTLEVMRRCLRPGDVFVDAGASIGQMSLYAAALVGETGRVVAIEPHPGRFASLVDAIALNRRRNVVACRVALGEEQADGKKLFCHRPSPSLVAGAGEGGDEGPFALVSTVRLDELLASEGLHAMRMIKIDVEGFEAQVLRGAGALITGDDAPIVCLEYAGLGADAMAALRHLQASNAYRYFNLRGGKARASALVEVPAPEQLRLGDNAFCLLDRHVDELAASGLFA